MAEQTRVRGIEEADWPAVAALEAEAYEGLGLAEGEPMLRSRARAAAGTCFVLDLDGRIAGYVLALPYPAFRCPDLTRPEHVVHHSPNLHLHDLVVARALRRRGLGGLLAGHLADTARRRGFTTVSLVAVGDKEPFWRALGYRAHHGTPLPAGYGADAVYMTAEPAAHLSQTRRPAC